MFQALKWRALFGRFPRLADSLQNRLILLVGWLFLLGMWSFVLVLTNHLENNLKDELVAQQSATAGYMADEIESKLRLRLGSLAMIAKRIPSKFADVAELQSFLEERRAVYNLFDFGLVVIRPDLHGAWVDFPVLAGRRVANWDVPPMRRVIDSGLPAVGVPRVGRFCNKPAVTLAAPVFDAKGQLVAILAGVVGLDAPYFLDSMNRPRDRKLGEVLLVSPQTRQMLSGSHSLLALANMPAQGASPVMDRLLGGNESAVVALDERGMEVLASAHRIPSSGWLVVVRVPTSVAYAPIRQHVFAILLIAVVVSLLVALLAAVLIRRSLLPMRQLADTLDTITRGDAPLHALPVAQADEVGRLTESINRLQASLGQEQTALRENETRLRTLIEALPDVIQFKDGDGAWLAYNGLAQQVFSLQDVECRGKTDRELAELTPIPAARDELLGCRASDEVAWKVRGPTRYEERVALTNGEAQIFDLQKIPLFHADGSREGLVIIARDITGYRRITAELQRSLQEFNGLVERIPVAVFKFRALGPGDFRFDYVSPRWVEMIGVSAEAVAQDARLAFAKGHPEDLDAFMQAIEAARIALTPFAREVRLLDERGLRWLRIEASPHALDDGTSLWEGIQYDITERKQAEERLRLADFSLNHVNESAFMADESGHFFMVNAAAWNSLGYTREELLALTLMDVDANTDAAAWATSWADTQRAGSIMFESRHRTKSGAIIPVEINASHFQYEGKSYILGLVRDITERKRAEAHQKLAASVFTNTQEGIVITDAEAHIVDINEAFTRLTGYSRDEVLGKNPNVLSSGHQSRDFYRALWQTLLANGHWSGEIWNRRKDGVLYAERLSISAVAVEPGQTSHYVGVFSDITHIKEHQRQLEAIAHYDPLTGVPNRLLLADRMRQAIAQTHRNQDMLAVCYLDLDGFKAVNDHFGHEAGDLLLVEMANRFRNCLRGEDTVARLGGDEFVLLLLGLKGIPECEQTLRRVLDAASQPVHLSQQSVTVSASIGVTLFPRDNEPSETLLRHADQAMYVAKQSGKNRYYLFDPDSDRQTRQRHDSLNLVAEALQRREFELYYQPKVNMRTGVVIGAEALIRWRHPERGLLLPGEFLPAIEDSELIVSVGHWVIETALAQLESWHRRGLTLSVSINVAARQLLKPDFVSRLQTSLAQYPQLIPGHVELEVLETAALEDMAQVSSVIVEGARLGVGFALDDFGTGYSSLAYLKRLPADTLKIDQSFVRDMLRDPEDLAIVEGVIGLTEVFHREVIAEGVETEELGVLLINLGCEMAQGYAIAQPMPANRLPQWVKHWVPPLAWTSAGGFRLPREDLPLIIAEHDHRRWVDALTTLVEGGSIQEPPVMDLHLCRFGRRYDRAANSHYQHRPEYAELGPIHAQVHEIGQAVVDLLEAGERDAARRRLQELYVARDRLVQTLHQLLTNVG